MAIYVVFMVEFPERLKQERERLGYSQRRLATVLGITHQTQMKYESGASAPNTKYLNAVKELGFRLSFLLDYEQLPADQVVMEESLVDVCVKTLKEVELSSIGDDGYPLSLGLRMRKFKEALEDSTSEL